MSNWHVHSKNELIYSVSESNDNRQIGEDWMCERCNGSKGFGSHMYFIVDHENDTIGYRGIVATREEINYYSKTGSFLDN